MRKNKYCYPLFYWVPGNQIKSLNHNQSCRGRGRGSGVVLVHCLLYVLTIFSLVEFVQLLKACKAKKSLKNLIS